MEIIKITASNFETYKSELVKMNDAFLAELDIQKVRSYQQKVSILKHMIKENSPSHILIGIDDNKKVVATTYFNIGTGYSSGGDYLWLNGIYVSPEEQQKGYGTKLLAFIQKWAAEKQVTYILSSRDKGNVKSEMLFKKAQFGQSENIWMSKKLAVRK